MFTLLSRIFIKEDQLSMVEIREKYGVLCSILSIIANFICVAFKLVFGIFVHSSAIIADGYNNLSDAASNIASLTGFKLAGKKPDAHHPYGHGRYEYLTGLFISALIIYVGATCLIESSLKIINPVKLNFSIPALIALCVSIMIKLWMYTFNTKAGHIISSETLLATGRDSLNDVITTFGSMVALVGSCFTTFPLDGLIGVLLSLFVMKSGWDILRDMIDNLLGKVPDKEEINAITKTLMNYDGIYGVHDMMIHDYGPGRRYLIVHLEIDSESDMLEAHDLIDSIEKDISEKFQIFTTIHMDPIQLHDPLTNRLKDQVEQIIAKIDERYSIHDFRIVKGTHTKLIFDVLLPDHNGSEKEIDKKIKTEISHIDDAYECVIAYDYAYY